MRHFSAVQRQARELFNQQHSSDQSGAGEEDIPPWARQFFPFFEAMKSNLSALAQAAEVATQRHNVVSRLLLGIIQELALFVEFHLFGLVLASC